MSHGKPGKFKLPPLFKSEKDLLAVVNDPRKFSALRDVIESAEKVYDNSKKCKTLEEWLVVSEVRIPDFPEREKFVQALGNLIHEYTDEPEANQPT